MPRFGGLKWWKKLITMNQKCPSCGNYVEGKKKATIGRKMTRGAVKKGSAVATGALIGSVVPGLGTLVGGALGLAAGALMSDSTTQAADEIYDAAVGEIEYKFSCPKCGRRWTKKVNTLQQNQSNASSGNSHNTSNRQSSNQSNTYSQPATPCCDNTDWQKKFYEDFDAYLDGESDIISTKENVANFIRELEYNWVDCENELVRSYYYFLSAYACLQYSEVNWEDNLFSLGLEYANMAVSICEEDDEYRLLQIILQIADFVPDEATKPLAYLRELLNECPDIEKLQNNFIKSEAWADSFEDVLYTQIVGDFLEYYDEQDDNAEIVKLLSVHSFDSVYYRHHVYRVLSQAYYNLGDYSKHFEYTKAAIELIDYEECFDSQNVLHQAWLETLENLGYCYCEGVGVAKDAATAFEIYTKCAKLGSDIAMRNLGDIYENGIAVEQNYCLALVWYNRAITAGYEEAEEDINRVLEKLGIEKQYSGVYIPKKEEFYMDIEDVFEVTDRGVVISGQVKTGCVSVRDKIVLTNYDKSSKVCQIAGIEMFKKLLDRCEFGDNVGILLKGIDNPNEIRRGAFVKYYDGEAPVGSYTQDCTETSAGSQVISAEQEFLDELKACIEDDGEISPKERRLLERFRVKLGISAERAKELEESLVVSQLTDDEKEYLEEYKACIEEDGEISPKERRLLNRIRESLGISEERANEIEKL